MIDILPPLGLGYSGVGDSPANSNIRNGDTAMKSSEAHAKQGRWKGSMPMNTSNLPKGKMKLPAAKPNKHCGCGGKRGT